MFGAPGAAAKKPDEDGSEESITADEVHFAKPVRYAYDAFQEKVESEGRGELSSGCGGPGGSSLSRRGRTVPAGWGGRG